MILNRLSKTYPDGTTAVRELSLETQPAEFIVLLGPSGCGKTTSLRMVAGLETPTSGTISIGGADVTGLPPSRRDIGFVFQFYALYPHMTVRRNILFPLENAGAPKAQAERILDDVTKRLGIEALLDLFPANLSGGDQQRVALARAMVRRPAVYLMDEPLGTLDADRRLELREVIRAQQLDLGVTTVYVTHDQEEALSLADRIVVMDRGTVSQVGAPHDIYDSPGNLFVADFVGSPGMNLIRGDLVLRNGSSAFVGPSLDLDLSGTGAARPGPVVLGVRPEFVRADPHGEIPADVRITEYVGSHRICHVDTPLGPLRVRTPAAHRHSRGERLRLTLDRGHVRLFDPQTGLRL